MEFIHLRIEKLKLKHRTEKILSAQIELHPYNAIERIALTSMTNNQNHKAISALYNNRMVSNSLLEKDPYQEMEDLVVKNNATSIEPTSDIILREENLPDWIEENMEPEDLHLKTDLTEEQSEVPTNNQSIIEDVLPDEEIQNKEVLSRQNDIKEETISSPSSLRKEEKQRKTKKSGKQAKFLLDTTEELSGFSRWLLLQKPLSEGNIKSIRKIGKKKKKSKVEISAEASITKKKYIASEPLAKILAAQGHILDAIEMYQQISLLYPEKSSYFAARIEELKKTL